MGCVRLRCRQTEREWVRREWKVGEMRERARRSGGRRKGVMERRRYSLVRRSRRVYGAAISLCTEGGGEEVGEYLRGLSRKVEKRLFQR